MNIKITKAFQGDRKYFTIVFFISILILLSALITPLILDSKRNNWQNYIASETANIENTVTDLFKTHEDNLISVKNNLKLELKKTFKHANYGYKELIALVNRKSVKNFSVEVLAPNGKMIAWNEVVAVKPQEVFPLNYPIDHPHFFSSGLVTYLTVIDTVAVDSDIFYLIVSKPLEKHYNLQNKYFEKQSIEQDLTEKFNTQFTLYYDPYITPPKDGRKYSFLILNNYGDNIGLVSFVKPSLSTALLEIKEMASKIQSFLIALILFFIGFGLRKDYKKIKNRLLKLFVLLIYFAIVRLVFFVIGFPSIFITGPLADPANFASTFAGGLVKSPLEFFVTNIFLVVIGYYLLYNGLQYFKQKSGKKLFIPALLTSPVLAVLTFYTLRGYSASIKSVIFDSSIRYFKEPSLLPTLPSFMMNLNILMIGFACVAAISALLILTGKFIRLLDSKKSLFKFFTFFFLTQIAAYIFFEIQKEPLLTNVLITVFISLIFLLLYYSVYKIKQSSIIIIFTAVISSVISIIMLNYFNLQLEERSLKQIAYEINRADDELLKFVLDETLVNALNDEYAAGVFYETESNHDAEAFVIWSKSPMQRESLNSMVVLFDRDKNITGRFSVGMDGDIDFFKYFPDPEFNIPNIVQADSVYAENNSLYLGILPVTKDQIVFGYIAAAASYSLQKLSSSGFPDFLESNKAALGSVIDLKLIHIFKFSDKKLVSVYGDVFPSREQQQQIFNAKLTRFNDGWLNVPINGENYITFILKKYADGKENITTVSIKEKELTWDLFNFFKIFIVHTLVIFVLFLLLIFFKLIAVQYSFRTKLLFAFLVISIIPIAALAVYNRQVVEERTENSIFNELSQRSKYLENHVRAQINKHKDRSVIKAFDNAGKELGISFAVYQNSDQLYNSRKEFYNAGLFNIKLNSQAHFVLNYLSYREYLTREKINNYSYDAYYRKVSLAGSNYIIGVNDAFNKIELSYSTVDFDILLFGIYSFAVIIILIISTIFANQISAPIRRLTKATEAVARGDLNVQLEDTEKGEIKGLYDGFNQMTKELQKNQIEIAELERENAWKEMAKQVAHEIKNPLTPMKLSMQQLIASFNDKKSDFESVFKKLTQTVLNQIDNLSQIASEFSTLAKMPSLKLEVFDVIPVLKDTLNLFSQELTKVKLKTDIEKVEIEADSSQLRRMIINLVRNSIQADAQNVTVSLGIKDSKLEIIIEDDGTGIVPENREKIFRPNFTTKDKGMGIGLNLTKRFLENIDGEIILVKTDKSGTTFKVLIPVYHTGKK